MNFVFIALCFLPVSAEQGNGARDPQRNRRWFGNDRRKVKSIYSSSPHFRTNVYKFDRLEFERRILIPYPIEPRVGGWII